VRCPRGRRRLAVGDRVGVEGAPYIVIGVSGTRGRLADETGNVQMVTVTEPLTDDRFELVDTGAREVARAEVGVDGLPADAVDEASWWEATSSRWRTACRRTRRRGHDRSRSTTRN
jgi:hypothetical protein